MSYLQYMTVISFNKLNPDWGITIHEPKTSFHQLTWPTDEQKTPYIGVDYYTKLIEKPFVKLKTVDFNAIGFTEQASEVFKSDFIRWYLLSTTGGGWSDMDILYVKPLTNLLINECDTVICFRSNVHIIGFFLAKPDNAFFKKLYEEANNHFKRDVYQSIGSTLLNSIYPLPNRVNQLDLDIKLISLNETVIYPYRDYEVDELFNKIDLSKLRQTTIGVHWYNGSNISKDFNNSFDPVLMNKSNTITELLKTIQ